MLFYKWVEWIFPLLLPMINDFFSLHQVDNKEIPAHRNVLACVSPYLMDLFSAEQVNRERMTWSLIELLQESQLIISIGLLECMQWWKHS